MRKGKELGLERLRAEYHRFRNELSSIRSPCCSQRNDESSDGDDTSEKGKVWDSAEQLNLNPCLGQPELSKAAIVDDWHCTPRSDYSEATNPKNAGGVCECSSGRPRVRITATTLFTANKGQDTEQADPDDVAKITAEVPRITSPPSKSPRDPTPRSDATVRLPAGEMVLASSSMNIHIADAGVSAPAVGYQKPASSPVGRRFIRPAASRRLRIKIKDILEKIDTGQSVNNLFLGGTVIEAGASEAQAYLENVVSALSGNRQDNEESVSNTRETCSETEPAVSHGVVKVFHGAATNEPVVQVSHGAVNEPVVQISHKAVDEPVVQVSRAGVIKRVQDGAGKGPEASKEKDAQSSFKVAVDEPCTDDKLIDDKLIQCSLLLGDPDSAVRDRDAHTKEIQCSELVNDAEKAFHPPPPLPAIKMKKAYYSNAKEKGKAKADDYGKTLIARRAHQNDEFLERCREKVGNLLQGYRVLEEAAKHPGRAYVPLESGESSTRPKETEVPEQPVREHKSNAAAVMPSKVPASHKKAKAKVSILKEVKLNAKPPPAKVLNDGEFDYDQIYEEIGDLIMERSQIEELDRLQREHLSIPYRELQLREISKAGEQSLTVMGAKRSRTARSPAREPGTKLLRLNMGKIQPLLKTIEPNAGTKPKKYERLLAFKDTDLRKTIPKTSTSLEKENNGSGRLKKEKQPAWVRRMTESKPRAGIYEQQDKQEADKVSLSGTVKRRNVRPPESIFKAGKHINWLSSSPRSQPSQKNRKSSDGPPRRKFRKKEYKLLDEFRQNVGDQVDQVGQDTDAASAETQQTLKTDARGFLKYSAKSKIPSMLEQKKQDWVVVGDFCISELERKQSFLDNEGSEEAGYVAEMDRQITESDDIDRKDAESTARADFGDRIEVAQATARKDEKKTHVQISNLKDAPKQTKQVGTAVKKQTQQKALSSIADQSAIAGPSEPSTTIICLGDTETYRKSLEEELFKQSLLEVLLKNLLDEDQRTGDYQVPTCFGEYRPPDYHAPTSLEERRVPDAHASSNLEPLGSHQLSFPRSFEEYTEPEIRVPYIPAKAEKQNAPDLDASTSNFVYQAPRVHSGSTSQRNLHASSRPPRYQTSPRDVIQTQEFPPVQHVISRPDIKLTIDIVDRPARPVEPAASPMERQSEPETRQVRSKPTALTRTLAFRNEQPDENMSEEFRPLLQQPATRSDEVPSRRQQSAGVQISDASDNRPSVSVLPIAFPIIFPIQVPQVAQNQQRPPDAPQPAPTYPGESSTEALLPKAQVREIQTAFETPSSSPSTPSTPVSCPDREAMIEAALAPITAAEGRPKPLFSEPSPFIITGMPKYYNKNTKRSPRDLSSRAPPRPPNKGSTEATGKINLREDASSSSVHQLEGLDEELVRDIERREILSPKSDRSSLHVEHMESFPWEQNALSPGALIRSDDSLLASSSDEGIVAASYDRGIVLGSPSSSSVVEETHLLSQRKFRFEEEDLVTMQREATETDDRRTTHIYMFESRPTSPVGVDKASTSAKKLPVAPTVYRKEISKPALEIDKDKQQDEITKISKLQEELTQISKLDKGKAIAVSPPPVQVLPRSEPATTILTTQTLPQHTPATSSYTPPATTSYTAQALPRYEPASTPSAQASPRYETPPTSYTTRVLPRDEPATTYYTPPEDINLQYDYAPRQVPAETSFGSPKLLPRSKLKVHLERGPRGKFPLLFGRRVLPSKDMKVLAELQRKAATALRGVSFRNTPLERPRIVGKPQHFNLRYRGIQEQPLLDSSNSSSISGRSLSGSLSTSSGSGDFDGYYSPNVLPSQLSEGEVDPGQICFARRGDETREEGEAPSVGEIR